MNILNVLIIVVIIILNKCDNKITDTNHDSIYDNKDIIEEYALSNKPEFRNYIDKLFKESLKDLT